MLKAGQTLLLNNRAWRIRQIEPLDERNLGLETIGVSEAAQGMTRRMRAIQYGEEIFIEPRQGSYWRANLHHDWVEGEQGPRLNCHPATWLDVLAAHTHHPASGDLKNEFSWSYSRAARYDRCPRAYYYHYYAAWEGWRAAAPPPVRRAYLLKNLTSLSLWVGTVVHEAIRFAMARLKAGQPVANDELIRQMQGRAQGDFDDSRSGRSRQNPQEAGAGFQEHYYQTDLSKKGWQVAQAQAEQCLRTFINSPLYASLQGRSPASFLNVETLQSFLIAGTKVWVQMDLARYEDDTIYLYDWSCGRRLDEAAARQQLGVYGLFMRQARPEWATAPIRAIVFSLVEDRLFEFDLSEAALQARQASIEASIAQLRGLLIEPETNLAEMRRFPMIDELQICQHCQFRELCGR